MSAGTSLEPACCSEFASVSRRGLLRGAVLGSTTVFGTAVVTRAPSAYADDDLGRLTDIRAVPARNVLVVLSMRGAADGLSLVVPHGDPAYYRARPTIAIPRNALLAADSHFGLHPALAPLLPMWKQGTLGAVHAAGLPVANRSHFAAMEELEDADPGSAARVGWLNRLIGQDDRTSPLQAIAVGTGLIPTSLTGPQGRIGMDKVESVKIAGADENDKENRRPRSLHQLWGPAGGPLGAGGRAALDSVADFAPAIEQSAAPRNDAKYPAGDLGAAMASIARVVRGNVGTEVFTVDHGDWDMHTRMGHVDGGQMQENTAEFASAVAAFFTDLGAAASGVTLVTISEFGRRVVENANGGTDHGHGNVMFVAGAGVRGGRFLGRWPGLEDTLDADLRVTTDYRSVLAEVVKNRFGVSTAKVFPGFQPEAVNLMRV